MSQYKIFTSPSTRRNAIQRCVVTSKYGDTCPAEEAVEEEEEAANHCQATHATTCRRPPNTPPTTMLQRSAAELACTPLSGPPTFHEIPEIWTKIASFLGARALGHLACTALRFRAVLSTCVSTLASKALDEVNDVYRNVRGHVMLHNMPFLFLREQRHGLGRSEGIYTHPHIHTCGGVSYSLSLSLSLSLAIFVSPAHTRTHTTYT